MTNVLLIILDSVRACNTSLHDYERQTTPFLEDFSKRAIKYTQARSPGVGSIQSHTSIFTGFHVEQHKLGDNSKELGEGHTIWEELAKRGYDTGVFSYNSYLTQAPIGLKDVFDVVESGYEQHLLFPDAYDPSELESDGLARYREFLRMALKNKNSIKTLGNGLSHWETFNPILPKSLQGHSVVSDDVFTDLFLQWQEDSDGPWAACVNYMGAHSPYLPDKDHDKWASEREHKIMNSVENSTWSFITDKREYSERASLENLYDGSIHQVDAEVERLITELESRGILNDTFIVITSDHGEGFGERGRVRPVRSVAHGNTGGPEEQILHVPLLVFHPDETEAVQVDRVASLTAFPDAVRTVLDEKVTEPLFVPDDGDVLASMFEYTSADWERLPDFVTKDEYNIYGYGSRAIYQTNDKNLTKKYVEWNNENSVFDCTDVHDTVELDCAEEDTVKEKFESLEPVNILNESTKDISDEVEERLEKLGYR